MMNPLERYVELHNDGVRTGSFTALGTLLTDDAQLHFHGLPVGSFVGREAILQAFATHPPDDELVVRDVDRVTQGLRGRYSWRSEPQREAGTIEITVRAGRIAAVHVTAAK